MRVLFDQIADIASIAGTGEQDLTTNTLAAGELANDGDKIIARYSVQITNSAGTKTLRLNFGGTTIYQGLALVASNAFDVDISVMIIRVSASVVRCTTIAIDKNTTGGIGACFAQYTEVTGLTLANAQILKLTTQQASSGAGRTIARMSSVEKHAAA